MDAKMNFEEFKNKWLEYLESEKKLTQEDIQNHLDLPDNEKVELGYLIKSCRVIAVADDCYELSALENNSKLRAGDKVLLFPSDSNKEIKATIVDNFFNTITLIPQTHLDNSLTYDIQITEAVMLDPLIQLVSGLEDGDTGSAFIKELCQSRQPKTKGVFGIDPQSVRLPSRLNNAQHSAIENVLYRPSLYCIQGPPGTGKTDVLSEIAKAFSERGHEVLIISNTHQAVNNALNKIAKTQQLPIVKIGEALKAMELLSNIQRYKTFIEYMNSRPKRRLKYEKGAIVGMTLHAAIINLGLRKKNGFAPSVVLVDEAGQIPLTFGAAIGTFGSGSIVFIGDDRQMPPIFHPMLLGDELSVSIFSYITTAYPASKIALEITYRMNDVITKFVSSHFYEPHGITLHTNNLSPAGDDSLKWIDTLSLPNASENCVEQNEVEATAIAREVSELLTAGIKPEDIAVITPYRKQVVQLRTAMEQEGINRKVMPLVDTVERLQGQDVDYIFISFATSVRLSNLSIDQCEFLLNPNRINVMISRAKSFVRLYSTKQIHDAILKI